MSCTESNAIVKINAIINFLKSIKGIREVRLLTNLEKEELIRIEEEAEKAMLMGLLPGVNQGVREALSRTFVLAAITDNDFEWPIRGTVKLVYEGELIGEDVRDRKELERLKNEGNKVMADSFVLYVEKMSRLGIKRFKDMTLVIAPLDLSWTKEVPYAKHVVVGSPSPLTDLCIKRIMGWKEGGGTILIGFELRQNEGASR